jgi:hypothetical protein
MRDNELIYGDLGDFEIYGGYHRYCDTVGTCGIYVEGNAEIAAAADFISRHLLILGADSDHDVYIFAGAIGLGEPANLGVDESPIIIAHCRTTQHYTRTRIMIQRPWCAPKTAKRARIEELRLQNEIEANVKECARAAVITHARSLAEQARISLRKKEELNLPSVATDEPTPIAPIAAPSIADPLPAFAMPIFESTIDALSPAPSVPNRKSGMIDYKKIFETMTEFFIQVDVRDAKTALGIIQGDVFLSKNIKFQGTDVYKTENQDAAEALVDLLKQNGIKSKNNVEDYIDETITENYARFKRNSTNRPAAGQLHEAIKAIKKKLQEVNRLVEYTQKLREEVAGIEEVKYNTHTVRALEQIQQMIKETYIKAKKLK